MQATEADYYPGSSVRARLMRWLATRADALAPAVLSNSEAFLEGDPRRIAVVPPGIDLTVFGRRGPGAHGKAVVGTLGRKEPWKGTDRVLRAIRDGGLAADVSVHVADFGFDLSPFADLNIEAVRPAHDSELAEWYRGLDFYVVGAYGQEGAYHYPCLEAMASGVCLITPWYRPADAAVAWLVPSSDPKELAPAIRAAIHSPADRRVRINAARRRAEDFSWPGIAARALAALEKAAGGAGVPSAIQGRTSRAAKTH
jgi:glycosyltransferase involved in cell wall biosynthesis